MKRKAFIISASAAAIGLPSAYYFFKNKWNQYPIIAIPEMLSNFCGEDVLHEIGAGYLSKHPAEADKKKLKEILLTNSNGAVIKESDDTEVAALLGKKVQLDFELAKTIIIKGWILSVTEARQCAVFSLTRKK